MLLNTRMKLRTPGRRSWTFLGSACLLLGMFAPAKADDAMEARLAQLAKLAPAEQEELLRKQERFSALPPEEQQRLREFQSSLDGSPNSERLQQVLVRYHEWLKTLTPSQRAKLAELPPSERVTEIKRIQQYQNAARERIHRADLLSWGDMRQVLRWTEDFVWSQRQELLSGMSKEQRQRFDKLDRQKQRRALLLRAFERSRRQGPARGRIGAGGHRQALGRVVRPPSPSVVRGRVANRTAENRGQLDRHLHAPARPLALLAQARLLGGRRPAAIPAKRGSAGRSRAPAEDAARQDARRAARNVLRTGTARGARRRTATVRRSLGRPVQGFLSLRRRTLRGIQTL